MTVKKRELMLNVVLDFVYFIQCSYVAASCVKTQTSSHRLRLLKLVLSWYILIISRT